MGWGVMIECCRGRRLLLAGLLAIELTACQTDDRPWFGSPSVPEFTAPTPGQIKYYPSDEPLKLALEHFDRGNYGTAERYFRDAVEKAPRDATAWVGLAQS
jgi:Tfp pilus assembly protein PilF